MLLADALGRGAFLGVPRPRVRPHAARSKRRMMAALDDRIEASCASAATLSPSAS
jgi:hypothetical protein